MTGTDAVIRAELQKTFLMRQDEIIGEIECLLPENGPSALDIRRYVAKDIKTRLEQNLAWSNAKQTIRIRSKTYCERH